MIYNTHCVLLRNKKDTVFGGEIWIENDSIDVYYDLKNIYIIDQKKEKITKYFPHKGQDWAINGRVLREVKDIYYLKHERLLKYLKDSTITHQLSDTLINKTKHYKITFRFADELPIEQQKKNVIFNNENLITKMFYSVKFQNGYQYNEWNLKNIQGNKTTSDDLKDKFSKLTEKYELTDYVEPDKKELEPLKNGVKAPDFIGTTYRDNKTIKLSDYINRKVVLIDFWYKDCYPCIKAIPHLSELNTLYSNLSELNTLYSKKGLIVLGLNPYDNEEKERKKLPGFLKYNNMNYPIVFIEKKTLKDFKVKAFPTFYIIDKNGKIVHSQVGFDESIVPKIDSIINVLIK